MSEKKLYRYYARMSSAVLLKVILAAGGFWIGQTLDRKYGSEPYLMFLFFIVGVSVGLWWVIRNATRDSE